MPNSDSLPEDVAATFSWPRVQVPDGTEDLTGRRFGMLLSIYPTRMPDRQLRWVCRCDCGNVKPMRGFPLRTGDVTACGCRRIKDPGGARKTRLFSIWRNMMARCSNRDDPNYGGRGIAVCPEWHTFERFAEWARSNGYADDLTIDRRDNEAGYEPCNCRWVGMAEQANNTRRTLWIEHDGERLSVAEWAKRLGVNYHALHRQVIRRKRTIAEAVAKIAR